jgi:hypothetical protein
MRHVRALVVAALCCAGCEAVAGYSDDEQFVVAGDGGPCPAGELACDGGLCVDPSSDARNCGACGHVCGANQACVSGACVCAAPSTVCGASCVDLQTDASNCAACGRRCWAFQHCTAGVCGWK